MSGDEHHGREQRHVKFHLSDFELSELRGLLEVLSKRYFELAGEASDPELPEGLAPYDEMEATVGLAFVAAQACVERIRFGFVSEPEAALDAGPALRTGAAVVRVIHEAANIWKHLGERKSADEGRRRARVRAMFEQLGVDVTKEYPLANVLHAMKDQGVPDLDVLADWITEWRNAVVGPRYEIPIMEFDEDDEV